MSRNNWIRQFHRWIAIVFTLIVVANIIINITGLGSETFALWVGLSALVPLILMMLSGLCLFVLPYLAKRPRGQAASREA